jgi:hypothetical protein
MIFTPTAVAESAHIALGYRITIGQNRGDTSAREPRTYHGRGFSLCPRSRLPSHRAACDRDAIHRRRVAPEFDCPHGVDQTSRPGKMRASRALQAGHIAANSRRNRCAKPCSPSRWRWRSQGLRHSPPTRKPRAEPTTSAALRRILPPSNRRRAGDGDLIAGRDSPVSAAAGAAVPPLLVIDKREAAATAASFPYRVP